MTYDEFKAYVHRTEMYETVFVDSEGREILVIRLLDAYSLMNDIQKLEKQNEAL
jgi:hypothetical protein